jgi:hypothetical protein
LRLIVHLKPLQHGRKAYATIMVHYSALAIINKYMGDRAIKNAAWYLSSNAIEANWPWKGSVLVYGSTLFGLTLVATRQ